MNQVRLKQLQTRFGAAIDEEIRAQLARRGPGSAFYGMMGYQLGYVDAGLRPVATAGGKRFRPLLCLLACDAAAGSWTQALHVAAAIELLHNFSLIHDDIEDHDPERRHQPTVWKVWGEPQAINLGDGMFALANRVVAEAADEPEMALELARRFQDTALQLTEGQHMDMTFETRQDVTVEEYHRMVARKTGSLIAFSLWSGAFVGRADVETQRALCQFGSEFGDAFQIHDDMMGIWGSPTATGKEAANDLRNRKKTLPVLLAMERAGSAEAEELRRFFSGRSDDLEAVLAILAATDARREARGRLSQHLTRAVLALRDARMADEGREDMRSLAYELTGQPPPSS